MKKTLARIIIFILLALGGLLFYAGNTSEHYLDRIRELVRKSEVAVPEAEITLPLPEGEREMTYVWKYNGKNYSLNKKMYDSFFRFYGSLPVSVVFGGESDKEWQEKSNALFVREIPGDETLAELADSIKYLGEKNKLSEDGIAELAVKFVQTIPYDYAELEEIANGTSKIDYPYEVLYENKGICSDKSFLAFALLRKLGYGVSFFIFPEDQHMAVGLKCPLEYSDYQSGYCFVETTSLGNKIGAIPEILPQNRIASANLPIKTFEDSQAEGQAQPLGKVEILNESEGKIYTGIIDTFNTQKEINNLKITLETKNRELKKLLKEIRETEAHFAKMEKDLRRLSEDKDYEEYNDLVSKYNKELSGYKKEVKNYNQQVEAYNQLTNKYNQLVKNFYAF